MSRGSKLSKKQGWALVTALIALLGASGGLGYYFFRERGVFDDDWDGDGLLNNDEIEVYFTDPHDNDTDHDGLWDGVEVIQLQTDPLSNDSDSDGCDDFTEVKLFETDPLTSDCAAPTWVGGLVGVNLTFGTSEPHFVPGCPVNNVTIAFVPRQLYLYYVDQILAARAGNRSFYVTDLRRAGQIKILVIDNFNSSDYEESLHGSTCVAIARQAVQQLVGSGPADKEFAVLPYSVAEEDRDWGTALEYAIAEGVDVISLSQVAPYGAAPYFDLFQECVVDYRMVVATGTGNDNRGNASGIIADTLRYPSLHPATLVVGGVVYNETTGHWLRWDEGPSLEGSNWGRSSLTYNGTEYLRAVELVANCKRWIFIRNYYGVSWAIPQVAGTVAAMVRENPFLTPETIRSILLTSAQKINPDVYAYGPGPFEGWTEGWAPEVGYGKLDGSYALQMASSFLD